MARNKMFDNILKIYRSEMTTLSSSVTSNEIDLDLPRGYVAKIRAAIFFPLGLEDITGKTQLKAALVNDPDDESTYEVPLDSVQHDVVAEYTAFFISDFANYAFTSENSKITNFEQFNMDVVAARNMRFNGKDTENNGEAGIGLMIYYSEEEVSDKLMLNLLDIL